MKAKNAFVDDFENTLTLSDGKIKDLELRHLKNSAK